MSTNDQIILEDVLAQRRAAIAPLMDPSAFFGLFIAEQLLKDEELSWDEIAAGNVDGGGDGGIDAVYCFVNGVLIQEDTDLSVFRGGINIDLRIMQAKQTSGFQEAALQRLRASSEELLDLAKPLDGLESTYNISVIEAFGLFRRTYLYFAGKLPRLQVTYAYATLGDQPHQNVERQVQPIRDIVSSHFSNSEVEFLFIGARGLLDLARRQPRTTYEMRFQDSIPGQDAYVCLVALQDYYSFITDESGRLIRVIFDANVRDHQGDVTVNKGIRETLDHPQGEDFWWLNNGVTIITTKAVSSGKTLTLENPQIVNGLQTSVEIVNHFAARSLDDETRNVLVRAVIPKDEQSYERIIRATNSQTSIPLASLKATHRVHRDIEDYLKPRGWYYERRKNQYKNDGRPLDRIVTIQAMAQSVMSILLARPNDARARPSTLLKRDEDYSRVFNDKHPLDVYLICAELLKRVESFLKSKQPPLSSKEVNNLRFHVLSLTARMACGEDEPRPTAVATISLDECEPLFDIAYEAVKEVYDELGADDQVAKSTTFADRINEMDSSNLANRNS